MTPDSTIDITTFFGEYTMTPKGDNMSIFNGSLQSYKLNISKLDETIVTFCGTTVKNWSFKSCCLTWDKTENKQNAVLCLVEEFEENHFVMKIKGKIWVDGNEPGQFNVFGVMDMSSLFPWLGNYRTFLKNSESTTTFGPEVELKRSQQSGNVEIFVNGVEIPYEQTKDTTVQFTWDDNKCEIQFYQQAGVKRFVGTIWKIKTNEPKTNNFFGEEDKLGLQPWSAYYKTSIQDKSSGQYKPYEEFILEGNADPSKNTLTIGGQNVSGLQFNNPTLKWTDKSNPVNGSVTFYMQEGSRIRRFTGKVWSSTQTEADGSNIIGQVDATYLLSWSGTYNTYKRNGSTFSQNGPKLQIVGQAKQEKSAVILNETIIQKWTFNNPTMMWSDDENETSAEITFYFPTKERLRDSPNDSGPHFSGKLWKKGDLKPEAPNWIGDQKTPSPDPGSNAILKAFQNAIVNVIIAICAMAGYDMLKMAFR